jgi:hypothetical protein
MIQAYLRPKCCPSLLKLCHLQFMLVISETFLCSLSALQDLLDTLQLLMLFIGTLMYLESKHFLLVMFYNGIFLITKP